MQNRTISSRAELSHFLLGGGSAEYLFFWGHTPKKDGTITKTCFSQWFESSFQHGGLTYPTAEHFMMAEKARLFGDSLALEKILTASTPAKAKAAGREVSGFDDGKWAEHRWDIVLAANYAKFSQRPELGTFLLNTGDNVLVEASPVDAIWGIGLAAEDPNAEIVDEWKGLNLLGFALMEIRDRLRA